MKRKLIVGLLLLCSLAIAGGCAGGDVAGEVMSPEMGSAAGENGAASAEAAAQTGESAGVIGQEAARAAALEHAGLDESQVSRLEVEYAQADGQQLYEVEFYAGNRGYGYEIDGSTGALRSSGQEVKDNSASREQGSATAQPVSGNSVIGRDAAGAAALQHAGLVRSQISRLEVELDYEKGRQIYEVEFYCGEAEYDYEIDAFTGAVIAYEYETKAAVAAKGERVIGKDAAGAAALEHAGLSESQVSRLKVELDFERGRQIYEVEFHSGGREYEYEICAYTGTILSYEVENRS